MRIVFVTKFLPLPADSGGKQRSLAVLRRLTEVGDVTLVAPDDGRADHAALRDLGVTVRAVQPPGRIGRMLGAARAKSLSAGRFHTAEFGRTLHDVITSAPVDLLHVNYAQLAPHGSRLPARRRVLDLHNIESALMTSYSKSRRGVASAVAWFEAAALRRIEREAARRYDAFLVVSTIDRDRLLARPRTVLVCPNGWELGDALPFAEGPPIAVFVALLGWAPNIDAARWLLGAGRASRVYASGTIALHGGLAAANDFDNAVAIVEFDGGHGIPFDVFRALGTFLRETLS